MKIFLMSVVLMAVFLGCSKSDHPPGAGKTMGGFAIPVVGVKLVPQEVFEKISVVGTLVANESVEVKSQIESKITEIHFDEGQKVKQGDILLILDREKLEATLASAKANVDIAQTTFNRMKALVDSGAVSKQEFDQAQSELAAKSAQVDLIAAQLTDTVIRAPFDGVVGERQISLGQVINKDKLLTVIIDDDPMKVDFHIPERYTSRVQKDQQVELTVAAYPKETFKGEVYFIDPQVDESTRTFLVKAKIANPDSKLRRGMFAKLDLVVEEKPVALMVPESALIPKAEEVFIFKVDDDQKAQMVSVKTGLRQDGHVEILSGLKSGDVIVTEGYQKIGPGSAVSVSFSDESKQVKIEENT